MSEEKKDKKENVGKKSKLPVIIIALLVVILAGVGAFGFFYIKSLKSAAPPKVVEAEYSLGEFVVNLADEGGKRYLKLNIVMTYNSANQKLSEELGKKQNDLKDTTLSVLRAKKTTDLTTKGYEDLKTELITRYNGVLQEGKIIKMTFTSFLVQ